MANPDLSKVLSDYGVEHRALYDQLNNGRPYNFIGDAGIMIHHTGSENSSLNTIRYGYGSLPGPLSQFFVEMTPDPVIWVVSSGYCNHAGKGDSDVLKRAYDDEPIGDPRLNDITGNKYWYGVEVEGNTPDDFTDARYEMTVQLTAAMCDHFGWDPMTRVLSHKEWTTRKVDPFFDMDAFRVDVSEELHTPVEVPDINQPSPWAAESWQKAIDKGLVAAKSNPHFRPKAQWIVHKFDKLGLLD